MSNNEEPLNIEPESTMTGKELIVMIQTKYAEKLTPEIEAFVAETFDEAWDLGYRLGFEEGHDAAVIEQRLKEAGDSGWTSMKIEDL